MHNNEPILAFRSRPYRFVLTTIGISAALGAALFLLMFMSTAQSTHAAPRNQTIAFCNTVNIALSECEALLDFYNSTNGDQWTNNSGWFQSTQPCTDWVGISCVGGAVVELQLVSNLLSGTLPSSINGLKNLRRLELWNNHLTGELPKTIEDLNSLYALMLSGNQLTGDITTYDWAQFPNMQDLRLDGNQFTGQIPPVLGELQALFHLALGNNSLSGPIPDTFGAYCINGVGGMCQMQTFTLDNAGLTGTLPSSLGNLTKVKVFNIRLNQITGTVPIELANWRHADIFFADNNDLQGELQPFVGMTNLKTLRINANHFTGTIPAALGSLPNLELLWLHNNRLRGSIPQEVACAASAKTPPINVQFGGNLLTVDSSAAKDCLAQLSPTGDYRTVLGYQTVPPALLRTGEINDRYVELLWEPIPYGDLVGWYEIAHTRSLTETPQFTERTPDLRAARFEVRNLLPNTDYYFYVRTYSPAVGEQTDALYSVPTLQPLRIHTPEVGTRLQVYKEAVPVSAQPGEEITYRLTISATEGTASFALTDTVPLSMTLSETPSSPATATDGHIYYGGTVTAGAPVVIQYKARIDSTVAAGRILQSQVLVTLEDAEKTERHIVSAAVVVKGQPTIDTLVLIYTSGDNNLGPKIRELFQKAELATMPAGMATFLVYDGPGTDDAYYYRIQHDEQLDETCPAAGNLDCNGRYKLNETMWKWTDEIGAAGSLRDFVSSIMVAYPAKTVVLSLVGHGSGWSPAFLGEQPSTHEEQPTNREYGGLLWDESPDLALSTADLRVALTEAYAKTGQKIDLLYLDACLMAMSEVLYELRKTVDYVLASPGVSWTSFRYDLHLTWASAPLDAVTIGQQWMANETHELDSQAEYPYFYTLFHLAGTRVDTLREREDGLANALLTVIQQDSSSRSRIQTAAAQTACFDTNQDHYLTEDDVNCDLGSFAQQLSVLFAAEPRPAPELQEFYQTVVTAALAVDTYLQVGMDSFIIAKQSNEVRHPKNIQADPVWSWPDASGLSIYLPIHAPQDDWRRRFYNATFLQSAADGNWDEMIDGYYASDLVVAPAECLACVPPGPEETTAITTPVRSLIFLPLIQR